MKIKRVDFVAGSKQREPAFAPEGDSVKAGGMCYWLDDSKFEIRFESGGVILARRKGGGQEVRGYAPGVWGSFVAEADPTPAPAPQQGGKR